MGNKPTTTLSRVRVLHPLDHMYHIFRHAKFTLCMVCLEVIPDDNHSIENHFSSQLHENSYRAIFEICFPNSISDNLDVTHLDIIMNSVFDLSLTLGSETSYVIYRNDHVFCVICQLNICVADCSVVNIKLNLVAHLQSETHIETITNNVFWVYRLNRKQDLIKFHNTVVYCTACKQNVMGSDSSPLQIIAHHLQTDQHNLQEGSDSELRLCKQFDSLSITDNETSNLKDNQLSADLSNHDNSFQYSNCDIANGSNTLINNDGNNSMKLCKQFESLEVSDNESSSLNDYLSITDVAECHIDSEDLSGRNIANNSSAPLTCLKCGQIIEMYNDNCKFSMEIHCHTHEELPNTSDCLKFVFEKGGDYFCCICQNKILIFNKDIELSINRHLEDCKNDCKEFSSAENANNETSLDFLNRIFDISRKSVSKYKNFVSIINQRVFCELCNCSVVVDKDIYSAEKTLHNHFSNQYHSKQYQMLCNERYDAAAKLKAKTKRQNEKTANALKQEEIFKIVVEKSALIKKNEQFIKKQFKKNMYLCILCESHISSSLDEDQLHSKFVAHFNNKAHKDAIKSLKKYPKVCEFMPTTSVQFKHPTHPPAQTQLTLPTHLLLQTQITRPTHQPLQTPLTRPTHSLLQTPHLTRPSHLGLGTQLRWPAHPPLQAQVTQPTHLNTQARLAQPTQPHTRTTHTVHPPASTSTTHMSHPPGPHKQSTKTKHTKQASNYQSDDEYNNYMKQVLEGLSRSRNAYIIKINQKFVGFKDRNLFCKLCEKSVDFTENGTKWKSHCYSFTHERNVHKLGRI